MSRFHDARLELVLDHDIILHLDDNTQLPAERYRDRLYSAITGKRSRMKMRREKREEREEPDEATPPPAEATPTSERAKSADVDDITPKANTTKVIIMYMNCILKS